ncbi:MAG: twin-arginine translocation signal domain-containing protein, partial [Blastocatellia bacterium]
MAKGISRRQFIKRGAGTVAVGLFVPKLLLGQPAGGSRRPADSPRNIFVVIQLAGGNDGLNTVIPYTDTIYAAERP